jgi:Bacterial mobilisation protein (MobC)
MGARGRPQLPDSQRRSRRLWLRLTAQEQSAIQAKAEVAGLSLAEYLRRAALAKSVHPRTDGKVCGQLQRIGNNLNQIARTLNSGFPVDRDDLTRVIRHVDETLFRYLP